MGTTTASSALGLTRAELDQLFLASPAGEQPNGLSQGTALIATGTRFGRPLAFVAAQAWRGKLFDNDHRRLQNVLTPARIAAISADVYEGPSLLDGEPCVILDYSKASFIARFIRDEIRQVAPGEYLGLVFVRGRRIPLEFWLHFDDEGPRPTVHTPFDVTLEEHSADWIDHAPVQIEREMLLSASPEQVFAILADHERWPAWFKGMRRVRVDGAASGEGALRTVWVGASRVQERFSRWDEHRGLTLSVIRSNLPGLRALVEDWSLEPDGDGTRLTLRIGVEATRPFDAFPRFVRLVVTAATKGTESLKKAIVT